MGMKDRFIAWYARQPPPGMLRLLSIPIDHQLKTTDSFRYERARMVETAFGFAANNRVAGDYLEFGVFEGGTFVEAWRAARRYGHSARLHAFDSFQGLPEPEGADRGEQFRAGQYTASRDTFERRLRRSGVEMARVTVTPGFFDATLTPERRAEIDLVSAAIAWVDCDLYESTIPVLEFLTDVLVDGSVLCFDDWYCFKGHPDRGERRACSEWLERETGLQLTAYHTFGWAGQSFIVHRD